MAHAAYTSGCRADDGVERVLFARGAGGLLNPMEEGISAAMDSGRAAAYAIAEHLEKLEGLYTAYHSGTGGLPSYGKRQWDFVAGRAATFRAMRR